MVKVNETSECPTENILPFFMLEHNNDVYTNWIFNIVTKQKRKMCKFEYPSLNNDTVQYKNSKS